MFLYETVIIIRQDVSTNDVEHIVESLSDLIRNMKGSVVKKENWGLRTLAYEIHGNKKGHYVLLCTEMTPEVLFEFERKMRLSEDVIRFLSMRVKTFSDNPSPILSSKQNEEQIA